jgi:hypothetical protein
MSSAWTSAVPCGSYAASRPPYASGAVPSVVAVAASRSRISARPPWTPDVASAEMSIGSGGARQAVSARRWEVGRTLLVVRHGERWDKWES